MDNGLIWKEGKKKGISGLFTFIQYYILGQIVVKLIGMYKKAPDRYMYVINGHSNGLIWKEEKKNISSLTASEAR